MKDVIQTTKLASILMTADVSEVPAETAAQVYGVLDFVSKVVDKRLKAIKETVRDAATLAGKVHTPKTIRFEFNGGYADVTTPETPAATLDEEKLGLVLSARKIKKDDALDKRVEVSWVPNPEKLKALVAAGALSPEDLAGCMVPGKPATPRLSVSLDKDAEKSVRSLILG